MVRRYKFDGMSLRDVCEVYEFSAGKPTILVVGVVRK